MSEPADIDSPDPVKYLYGTVDPEMMLGELGFKYEGASTTGSKHWLRNAGRGYWDSVVVHEEGRISYKRLKRQNRGIGGEWKRIKYDADVTLNDIRRKVLKWTTEALDPESLDPDNLDPVDYALGTVDARSILKELGFTLGGMTLDQTYWFKTADATQGLQHFVTLNKHNPTNVVRYKKLQKQPGALDKELENKLLPIGELRRYILKSTTEAAEVIQQLLDNNPDAFDPRADLDRLIPQRCPKCGSTNVSDDVDEEGLIDCFNCGIWFNPLHPNNSPSVPGNYPDPPVDERLEEVLRSDKVVVGVVTKNKNVYSSKGGTHRSLGQWGASWRYMLADHTVYWHGDWSEHTESDEELVRRHLLDTYGEEATKNVTLEELSTQREYDRTLGYIHPSYGHWGDSLEDEIPDLKNYAMQHGRKPYGYVLRSQLEGSHFPWMNTRSSDRSNDSCGNFRRYIGDATVFKRLSTVKGYSSLDIVPVYSDPRKTGHRALDPSFQESLDDPAPDEPYDLAAEISDLKAYAMEHGLPPRILITYSRTTPESVREGDFSETGWIDEQGVSMRTDEFDDDEGISLAEKTAQYLWDEGCYETSSSYFHPEVWYSTEWTTIDYQTAEAEERNYHLSGFKPEQEREVWDRFQQLRRR